MRTILKSFVARALDRIIDIADYYIYQKRVSLSEALLFGLVAVRVTRSLFYGVQGSVMANVFSDSVWTAIFCTLLIVHFITFILPWMWPRVAVSFAHVVLWGFLAVLGVMAYDLMPGAGDALLFGLLAAFLTVRIWNEIGTEAINPHISDAPSN